ncbi:MAG TPA: dCTP deaminase [Solirubrobacteraceae bacterium]|jgi:dCTP deaminase|nr:dCTP deaminase [Solirubrobacteraceae bacterium]
MLSGTEIKRRLLDHESGLAITPIIDVQQIGNASVDLRLGPDFIVTRRATGLAAFDPARVEEIERRVREYQDYVRRPVGSAFYLHPGEFAVARTLEYLTVPPGTAAQVDGRSSWGRLGLVIQTAPLIQPRFEGTVTLELANVGTVPLVLYVGLRVAQVMFYDLLTPPQSDSRGRHAADRAKGKRVMKQVPAGQVRRLKDRSSLNLP